ncbi:MAG: GAF domain-containing protein [Proteobacteria bacterium]|nr:GAF domain-containing protein [Pseudomonadota bacterium]
MIGLREISLIFTGTTVLVLGIYVFSASPRREPNGVFGLLCIFASIWCFSILLVRLSSSPHKAVFWGRLAFLAVGLGVTFFLYFAFVFPERSIPKWIPHPLGFIAPGIIFAVLAFTDLILEDVRLEEWGYDSVHGPLHSLFLVYILSYISIGISYLFVKLIHTSSPIQKLQLKYVLIGLTVAPFIGLVTNGILPIIGNARFTDIGPTSFIVFVGASSYAIVKHRLMDIDFLIKKGFILLFSFIILCFPAFIFLGLLENFFYQKVNYEFTLFVILLIVLSSLVFLRIRAVAEEKIEKFLFKQRYSDQRTLMNFGRALVTILDLRSLCKRVIETVSQSMNVTNGSVYILDEEKASFELYEYGESDRGGKIIKRLPQKDYLFQWLLREKTVLVKEEWSLMPPAPERDKALTRMDEMQSEVCIPLISRNRVIGIINLGSKRNRRPYTIQDIELLTTLANQTAIAIENAKLYENLKKQKSIMRRADRLASLGTLTAGLAHEIRNPLVAIKTLTQLLPERLDDDEFRKDFLTIASGEVDRISSLVNELLEFARPTKPQFQVEDIKEIMDGMVLLISTEVKKKQLEISTHYEKNLPPIALDREQIKQVFLNLLLNAIEATSEGGQVSVEIRTFSKKGEESFLQVEIRDTGNGIPEEHLDTIFNPFFTTKKKGSGLGLSNAHQIVLEHGGILNVESHVGEGSSFFVNLPLLLEETEEKEGLERESQTSQHLP